MNTTDLIPLAKKIKLLICDVDGVLTDGTVYMGAEGVEFKQFNVLDGAGCYLARTGGLKVALISGRYSPATATRAEELPLEAVYNGAANKIEPYQELLKKLGLDDSEIAYVGDDIIDIPILERVGLPVAVSNAYPTVKKIARYVTKKRGGEGAMREVVDLIFTLQGRYDEVMDILRTQRFGEKNGQ